LELDKGFDEEPYKTLIVEALGSRKNKVKLDLDVKKLRAKYNNIKQ